MSFSEINLSLQNKCYVVKGSNKDNKGQQSNGSGKTSLLEIIAVALLGQSLTDRDLKSCVNRYGQDNYFVVAVTLTNEKDKVVIQRVVYSNTKSQELSIMINNEPVKDIPTKAGVLNGVDLRAGNQWILSSLLGISKEDLLNYFLISDNYYKGFLSSTNQDKINVISRFSNATLIDKAIEKIEKQKKIDEKEMLDWQRDIDSMNGQIQGLQYTISDEAKSKFELDKQRRLQSLLPNQQKLKQQLTSFEPSITDLARNQFECEEFYGRMSEVEQQQLLEQRKEIQVLSKEVNSLIASVNNKLAGTITCPNCEHQFVLSNESVDELKSTLESSQQDLSVIEQEIKNIDEQVNGVKLLKQIDDDLDRLFKQQTSLENGWNVLLEQIESIEKEQFQSQDITDKLQELHKSIEGAQFNIHYLSDKLDNANTWVDRFERFKYFLINKPISIICSKTNEVLQQIGSEYTISIDGFKKLKSGELRAELTPTIHIRGLETQPYSSFSAGERTRLDLACDLAIQQMINSTSKGGLNLYFSDEKISALDSQGIEAVAKSFDKLSKTILLVSHSGSDINYSNTITVQKQNKQSALI